MVSVWGSCEGMDQHICQGGRGKEIHVSSPLVRHPVMLVGMSHLSICPINGICLF